jgi:hypothetical protein
MTSPLIDASLQASVALLNAIDHLQEEIEAAGIDGPDLGDIQAGLVDAYHALTAELSLQIGQDARKLTRDTITSKIHAARAVLRAMTEGV